MLGLACGLHPIGQSVLCQVLLSRDTELSGGLYSQGQGRQYVHGSSGAMAGVVISVSLQSEGCEFMPWLCYILAVYPWTSRSTSLRLSFYL